MFQYIEDDFAVAGGAKRGEKFSASSSEPSGGGGGGKTQAGAFKGARGGSKQTNKRQARRNKHTSCYSSKHIRQAASKTKT